MQRSLEFRLGIASDATEDESQDEGIRHSIVRGATVGSVRGTARSWTASRYKHPVLGLVFLKYVSDNFEAHHTMLAKRLADPDDEYYLEGETDRLDVLEDRDEYLSHNVFWIPVEARWEEIRKAAPQPDVATTIDKTMDAIERDNPVLKGVLPKSFTVERNPAPQLEDTHRHHRRHRVW